MRFLFKRLLGVSFSPQFADVSARMLAILRSYRWRLVLVGLFSVFVVALDLLSAAAVAALVLVLDGKAIIAIPAIGEITNPLHGLNAKNAALASIGGIVVLQLLREAILFTNELISKRLGVDVEIYLKTRISKSTLSVPFEKVAGSKRNDLIVYGVNFAPSTAAFSSELVQLGSLCVVLALYAASAFVVEPVAFIAVGAIMLILIVVTNRMVLRQQRIGAELRDIQITYHDQLQDSVHGLRDITIAGSRATFLAMAEKLLGTLWRARRRSVLLSSAITPIQRGIALGLCGLGLMILVMSSDDRTPLAGFQGLLVVIFLLLRMYGPVAQLNTVRSALMMRLDTTETLLGFLDGRQAPAADTLPAASKTSVGDIVFDRVSYRYGGADVPAVEDLAFTIPAGAAAAIVGPSGAGKSTAIDLLTKLRHPASGEIRIGGTPLADIDDADWRRRIAAIHQHGHIFYGTIAENISMFRNDVDMADIEEAAARANLLDFVRAAPRGFDTPLGGPDTPLSGGQRQRLQIARAFLVKPAVLILDEATSAQDAIAEDELLRTLKQEFSDTTIVTVAHRFSAIREAELIIVLQDGRVAETGDWQTLSRGEGVFRRLFDLQSLETSAVRADAR